MKCKHCGKEIANESKFCEYCGTENKSNKSNRWQRILLIVCVAVVMCCTATALLGFTYYHPTSSSTAIATNEEELVAPKFIGTIGIDHMNVLYVGIMNPITLFSNTDVNKLEVSFPGCQLSGSGSQRVVLPPESMVGKNVVATLSSSEENITQTFRVKRVPDPTAYIGSNIWGGKRSKQELLSNPFISAHMGEDFAYDLKWTINSYKVTFIMKSIEGAPMACSGDAFNEDVRSAIQNASSGTVIIFSDIKASSIVGQRTLRDITVRIK